VGAELSQGTMGSDRPIAFGSRTLNDAEVNYYTVENEMLAKVWGIKHFRPYLFGHKLTIGTDHHLLTWLMGFKETNFKLVDGNCHYWNMIMGWFIRRVRNM